mmetsp:Transcript_18842/g.16677  ORF Transcript_18842/g.16677 Transcript_18842/m.16677 type:complete len:133 (+) Transcript_18842:6-404(+)
MSSIKLYKRKSELYRELEAECDNSEIYSEEAKVNPVLYSHDLFLNIHQEKKDALINKSYCHQVDQIGEELYLEDKYASNPNSESKMKKKNNKPRKTMKIPPNYCFASKQSSVEILKQLQGRLELLKKPRLSS